MRKLYWWLLLLVGGMSPTAWGACTVTMANAAFGSHSSIVINSTAQPASANLVVACNSAVSLLGNDTITLQLTGATATANSRATLKHTTTSIADVVPVRVCGKANCADNSEIAINGTYSWTGSVLLTLLATRTYTIPIYFLTVPGQQVNGGDYTVTLNFNVGYSICAILGIACDVSTTNPRTSQLTLNVAKDCSAITAPAVGFGSAPLVKNFPTISQNIVVTCTKGSTFTIGINDGIYVNGGVRYMANTASTSVRMAYEIYKGATTSRWGSSGAERRSSSEGTLSADNMTRTFNYTAKILTNQATPSVAGDYKDTLTVDIVF